MDRENELSGTGRRRRDFEIFCAFNVAFVVARMFGIESAIAPIMKDSSAVRLTLAEMPQVNHRIGQNFKCVVQLAEAIEPNQQAPEFIFPAEHPLDGVEPLFENGRVKERFAASLRDLSSTGVGVDVGDHPAIENRFAINPAIVNAVQANNSSFKVKAYSIGDARHQRQGFA